MEWWRPIMNSSQATIGTSSAPWLFLGCDILLLLSSAALSWTDLGMLVGLGQGKAAAEKVEHNFRQWPSLWRKLCWASGEFIWPYDLPGLTLWSTWFDLMIYLVWPYDLPVFLAGFFLQKEAFFQHNKNMVWSYDLPIPKHGLTLWSTYVKKPAEK